MSTADTAPTRRRAHRPRGELGDHVARTIGSLQAQVLRDPPRPEAISALARLRRGIGRAPGFDYTLEEYLAVPEDLLGFRPVDDTRPTDSEQAVHDALTLYALHQQSRREPMHTSGQGLGHAMARLIHTSDTPDGVRRRFAALGTATTYNEGIYHLRGLVTMLRGHRIPLDYGLLAHDLRRLRQPGKRADVQAVWGRELYRNRMNEPTANTEETSA
ncbi:hypothetical protein Val02_90980 [Virgisporangium aliadipatigenens]|uniref:Type I-E CRISPR-associated protein Cse2/CasB n=1 Tax=Virgisporangium aliadipatigenens TaxID=741659 RepID=A0A8J4DXL6_9ACTN|nr:type I-E CRISPR-associated protein Cse2/CasB [Virgisporangium aliadipatigenens]GIJ52212.1 hypothetical protein Val02_90980 [Virgisporangium aliadipatigenens]